MAKVESIVAEWAKAARLLETTPFKANLSTLSVTRIACSGKRKISNWGTASLWGRIDLTEGKDTGGMDTEDTVNHREHLTESKKRRKVQRLRKPLGRNVFCASVSVSTTSCLLSFLVSNLL